MNTLPSRSIALLLVSCLMVNAASATPMDVPLHGGAPLHASLFPTQALAPAELSPIMSFLKEPAALMRRLAESFEPLSFKSVSQSPNVFDYPLVTEAQQRIYIGNMSGNATETNDPELGRVVRNRPGHLTLLELAPGEKGAIFSPSNGHCLSVMIRAARNGRIVIGQATLDPAPFGEKSGVRGQTYAEFLNLLSHLENLELSNVEILFSVDERFEGLPAHGPLHDSIAALEEMARTRLKANVLASNIRRNSGYEGWDLSSLVTPGEVVMQFEDAFVWRFEKRLGSVTSVHNSQRIPATGEIRTWPGAVPIRKGPSSVTAGYVASVLTGLIASLLTIFGSWSLLAWAGLTWMLRHHPAAQKLVIATLSMLPSPDWGTILPSSLHEEPLAPGKISIVFGAMENSYNRVGGEGDYIADLPAHLAADGNQVYVVTPRYGSTPVDGEIVATLNIPIGQGYVPVQVKHHRVSLRLSYLFIEDPAQVLFQNKPYEEADKLRGLVESIILSRAIVMAPQALRLQVDAFHYNDWQTGLGPIYQRLYHLSDHSDAASIFISHNIAYKGIFDREMMVSIRDRVLGRLIQTGALRVSPKDHHAGETRVSLQSLTQLPDYLIYLIEGGLEWWGKVALFKGVTWADKLVAVSKGSLRDMKLPESEGGFAFGAEGIVQNMDAEGRTAAVHNGTDFTPDTDPDLVGDGFTQFSKTDPDIPARKRKIKRAMIEWLQDAIRNHVNLAKKAQPGKPQDEVKIYGDLDDVSENDFILGSLGRLTDQKGIDVLEASLERAFKRRGPNGEKIRLVIGASAEKDDVEGKAMEANLKQWANGKYKGQLLFLNGRVEKASRIYAGVDCFIMPSLFEPGGISNLIANIMGTPVIAALTGGLIDFFEEWGGIGFFIKKFTRATKGIAAQQLADQVEEASQLFWEQPEKWDSLITRATKVNVSWKPRVKQYLEEVYYKSLRRIRGEAWWEEFSSHLPHTKSEDLHERVAEAA